MTSLLYSTKVSSIDDRYNDYRNEEHAEYHNSVWLCDQWISGIFRTIYNIDRAPPQFTIKVYSKEQKNSFPIVFRKAWDSNKYKHAIDLGIEGYLICGVEINWTVWDMVNDMGLINKTLWVKFVR